MQHLLNTFMLVKILICEFLWSQVDKFLNVRSLLQVFFLRNY